MSKKRPRPGWHHTESPEGPILKNVEHRFHDVVGEELEDPWRRFQLGGFLNYARRRARLVIRKSRSKAQVWHAKKVIYAAKSIRGLLSPGSPLGDRAVDWRHITRLAEDAVSLGRHFERMMAREAEPDAERGKKTLDGARRGHEAAHGTDQQKQAKRASYQQTVDDLRARNPELSRTAIRKSAAKKEGVSPITIKRYTSIAPAKKRAMR